MLDNHKNKHRQWVSLKTYGQINRICQTSSQETCSMWDKSRL